jgi:hypothetical protein
LLWSNDHSLGSSELDAQADSHAKVSADARSASVNPSFKTMVGGFGGDATL